MTKGPDVRAQEHSQTLAPMRAPALGAGDSHASWNNPIIWWLCRYRSVGSFRFSRTILTHLLFGLGLGALMALLAAALPTHFALYDFNMIASVAVGVHMFWISYRMCRCMDGVLSGSFLDELLLTEMTPREIAGGIAQSIARPILASLLAITLPYYLVCAGRAIGSGSREQVFCTVAWGILAPFVALTVFALPWLGIRRALLPPSRQWATVSIVYLWAGALPASALLGNVLASSITVGVLLFLTISYAVHTGSKIPGMLAKRE